MTVRGARAHGCGGADDDVLGDGEVFVQLGVLERASQRAAHALVRRAALEVWSRRALIGAGARGEPGQRVEQRRLAGTVGADQADDGALAYVEVDTVDGDDAAVPDAQVADLEHDVSADDRVRARARLPSSGQSARA